MDEQIKKVKKDVQQKDLSKAKNDLNRLMKMDKKFDKEVDECRSMKKKRK